MSVRPSENSSGNATSDLLIQQVFIESCLIPGGGCMSPQTGSLSPRSLGASEQGKYRHKHALSYTKSGAEMKNRASRAWR